MQPANRLKIATSPSTGHTTPAMILSPLLRRTALLAAFLTACALPATAAPRVGDPLPAFEATLLSGKTTRAADFAGKPLIIVFWAAWCPPCRPEMVMLDKLFRRYQKEGVNILAISLDNTPDEARRFLRDTPVGFLVAMSNEKHRQHFGPMLWPPRMFLFDREGRLVESQWGVSTPQALETSMRKLL
jgi:peroxiredoxin